MANFTLLCVASVLRATIATPVMARQAVQERAYQISMTAIRIPSGAVLLKILSTGLIVSAVSTTSLLARENCENNRHAVRSVRLSASRTHRRIDGRRWIPAPAASASTTTPSNQPGGVCDVGDNPRIC